MIPLFTLTKTFSSPAKILQPV